MEEVWYPDRIVPNPGKSKKRKKHRKGVKSLSRIASKRKQSVSKNAYASGEIFELATATKVGGFWRCYIPFLDLELEGKVIDEIIDDVFELYQGEYILQDVYQVSIDRDEVDLQFVFTPPIRRRHRMVEEPAWWETWL